MIGEIVITAVRVERVKRAEKFHAIKSYKLSSAVPKRTYFLDLKVWTNRVHVTSIDEKKKVKGQGCDLSNG